MTPIDEKSKITEAEPSVLYGQELLNWEFQDRIEYRRGVLWYLIAFTVGLGLLAYAVLSGNFLFALIIVMGSLLIYLTMTAKPSKISFALTEDGVRIGRSFYPYRELKSFWFFYEPPEARNLYLDFRSALRPRLAIDLANQNPNSVRKVLSDFIKEDLTQEDEPLSDTLGRVLKI